jgi:dUTP pyrophosphatase
VVNTPGTIDCGYRGEIRICLINHDLREPVVLRRGDRIAQLVVQQVARAVFREVADVASLGDSERGANGYGSTGGHRVLGPASEG